jgi:hypothetical protein
LVLAWGYNPVVAESEILPSVQAVDILRREEPIRIATTDGVFWPNYPAAYGISDVAGHDLPVYRRYSDLYRAQGGQADYRQSWNANWPLIDYLNTEYVITPQELDDPRLNIVFSSEGYRIYENADALPRAYMVYDVDVIEDKTIMLDHMLGGQWDPRATALLEESLSLEEMNSLAGNGDSRVDFTQYSNDTVVLDVTTDRPGLLVMSDLFTRDWIVQVDEERVKLYRANYAYRGVFVPEGEHRVTFAYLPNAFFLGAGLTALGSAIAILLLALAHTGSARSTRQGVSIAAGGA